MASWPLVTGLEENGLPSLYTACLTLISFGPAGEDWIILEMLSMCNILYIGQALPLSMRYDMALAKVQQNIVKSRMAPHKSPQLY